MFASFLAEEGGDGHAVTLSWGVWVLKRQLQVAEASLAMTVLCWSMMMF